MNEVAVQLQAEIAVGNAPLKPLTKARLKERVDKRLTQLSDVLEKDDLYAEKIRRATFKDLTVAEAILVDKWLLLNDQPTQIIDHTERKKLDELLPALTLELQRRGFTASAQERTLQIVVPPTKENDVPVLGQPNS